MAAQHLPRYLGGLAVDKRRTFSNERREKKLQLTVQVSYLFYFLLLSRFFKGKVKSGVFGGF